MLHLILFYYNIKTVNEKLESQLPTDFIHLILDTCFTTV